MYRPLLIVTGIYPPDSGGPSKFTSAFAEWTSKKGAEVVVQTYSDSKISEQISGGVEVSRIQRSQSLLNRYVKMIRAIGAKVSPETKVLAAGAFLETYISSLVYRFSYVVKVPGDIVWERARNNKVTNLNIEEFQNLKLNFKYRVFRRLYSNSLRKARLVIVPSLGLYNLCLRWGVSRDKLRLIYNSVELPQNFTLPVDLPKFDLATICRLAPWKGVDELIEYCAKRNLKLVIAGDGPDRERLEFLTQALDARVTFLGDVSSREVNQVLRTSKIFVLNSYYEGLPHALVEARVAGLLAVGRSGTGSEEVIEDEIDGFLIRPDRPLDQTLDLALSSISKSNEFAKKAQEDSRLRFNKENNFGEIFRVLQGVK
jgi:glycosyltransferase involved in cell wall biosynthesis